MLTKSLDRRSAAFTLAEVLVGVGVGSIAAIAVMALSLYSGKTFAGISNYLDMESGGRTALDRLTTDIRAAQAVTAFSKDCLTVRAADGTELTYTYRPSTRELERTHQGLTSTVLKECDQLQFALYQAPADTSAYDTFSTGVLTNSKVVTVSWTCSRSLLGNKVNTENVQSAKIVIRAKL